MNFSKARWDQKEFRLMNWPIVSTLFLLIMQKYKTLRCKLSQNNYRKAFEIVETIENDAVRRTWIYPLQCPGLHSIRFIPQCPVPSSWRAFWRLDESPCSVCSQIHFPGLHWLITLTMDELLIHFPGLHWLITLTMDELLIHFPGLHWLITLTMDELFVIFHLSFGNNNSLK